MAFPKPVDPPRAVREARLERQKDVMQVTFWAILLRTCIVAIEMAGYILFDSAVLFMDALATMVDISASLILLLTLKYAAKPPDRNHPFGHGRLEPIMGLQLSLLLVIVGGGMLFQQVNEINHHNPSEQIYPYTWVLPFVISIALLSVFFIMKKVAKNRNSTALASESEHLRADAYTSILATIVLLCGYFFPAFSTNLDHMGAIIIAFMMIILGFRAAKQNMSQLMDEKPDPEYFAKVSAAAKRVKGVFATEKIRIQLYGPNAHIDIDVEVDPKQTVEKAHIISQKVRVEIQKDLPEVQDVIVHLEPYYPGDHAV